MSVFTAHQAKQKFGLILDKASEGPVHIYRRGRAVAVVISTAQYRRALEALDLVEAVDVRARAKEAAAGGEFPLHAALDLVRALRSGKLPGTV